MVREHAQQCRASRSRASENEQHLAGLNAAVRVVNDCFYGGVLAALEEGVELGQDVLVECSIATDALDGEVLPGDAELPGFLPTLLVSVFYRLHRLSHMPCFAVSRDYPFC